MSCQHQKTQVGGIRDVRGALPRQALRGHLLALRDLLLGQDDPPRARARWVVRLERTRRKVEGTSSHGSDSAPAGFHEPSLTSWLRTTTYPMMVVRKTIARVRRKIHIPKHSSSLASSIGGSRHGAYGCTRASLHMQVAAGALQSGSLSRGRGGLQSDQTK